MEIRIIKSEELRQRALVEIERLMSSDPTPESSEGSRLEVLAKLVEDFEKAHFPIENCDPVDAITFHMEEGGLKQKDIAHLLGGKNRASEVLSRKRPLTLPMIRSLSEKLGIPLEVLIREPITESAAVGGVYEAGWLWMCSVRMSRLVHKSQDGD